MTDELAQTLANAIEESVDCHCYDDGDGRFDEMVDVDVVGFQEALRLAGYEVRRLTEAEQ